MGERSEGAPATSRRELQAGDPVRASRLRLQSGFLPGYDTRGFAECCVRKHQLVGRHHISTICRIHSGQWILLGLNSLKDKEVAHVLECLNVNTHGATQV